MNDKKNIEKKYIPNGNYSLKLVNDDNELDDNDITSNKIIINENENIRSNQKIQLNYSLIMRNVINDITNNQYEKKNEDEYTINLLLMSSINNIFIKALCLNLKFKLYENKKNYLMIKYIIEKVSKFYENNKNLNLILFSILNSSSEIFKEQKNVFYAYYFLRKAKSLLTKTKNDNELKRINSSLSEISGEVYEYINSKYEEFKNKNKMDQKKLNSIVNIINEILIQKNAKKEDNNGEHEIYGSYLFAINKDWVVKAKIFIDCYKAYANGMMDENFLESIFSKEQILYNYFNDLKEKEDKNPYNTLYPGPIDNFNLLRYKDFWEDPVNDDENYYIKENLVLNKDYYLISQRNWNILNEVFDSSNEIKISENNSGFIELKPLILDKRLIKNNDKYLLKRRNIQIKNNSKIKILKEKIIRCINHELKKKNKSYNNANYFDIDDSDEYEEMEKMKKNTIINFFLIEKRNKNILIEICISFSHNFSSYDSVLIKEIKLGEDEPVNSLFKIYNKKEHILIIEISDKNYDNFLKEIKPFESTKNKIDEIYQCRLCENEINKSQRYECKLCKISFFCSQVCSNNSIEHAKLHKLYSKLLRPNFDLNNLKKKKLIFEDNCRRGIAGLFNLGNTCYINCCLQCLSNTEDFTKYFLLNYYKYEENFFNYRSDADIIEEFSQLLKKLWEEREAIISPRNFRLAFCRINSQFAGQEQQDAQEFLSALINILHERLNRIITEQNLKAINEKKENESELEPCKRWEKEQKLKNNSIIYDLFNGQFISTIICQGCGKKSTSFEQFNILSLPIPKKHCSLNIKYFTKNDCKNFPFSINKSSTFMDLKDKALFYYKDDIIQKLIKNFDGNLNDILKEEKNNIIYNYNNTKISRSILYKFIDILILDKSKMIIIKNIKDNEEILPLIDRKEYEIVLYEKELISSNYVSIYITATNYHNEEKNPFYKYIFSKINNYSYPVHLAFEKNTSLENLNKTLKNKFKNILNYNLNNQNQIQNKNSLEDPIKIIILHYDKLSPCNLCNKTLEESRFCLLEDLLNKNYTVSDLSSKINNFQITLVANSAIFYVHSKCFKNNVLYFNPENEENEDNEQINIYDCLEKFREEEILENENKWYCDNCKIQQTAKKKIQIFKSPQYLIIQLKRFKYNNNIFTKYFERTKIDTFVKISKNLDLKDFVNESDKNNSKYELYANILHIDNHYKAVCKNGERWVLYDDDSCYKNDFPNDKNSYILFYKKI